MGVIATGSRAGAAGRPWRASPAAEASPAVSQHVPPEQEPQRRWWDALLRHPRLGEPARANGIRERSQIGPFPRRQDGLRREHPEAADLDRDLAAPQTDLTAAD